MARRSPASSRPPKTASAAVDGALDKTRDFLGGLASDKYGGELLPTVISMRELIESFDKKSGHGRSPRREKCWRSQPVHQQQQVRQRPPPRRQTCSLESRTKKHGNARRARQIHRRDRPARHRDPRRERGAARTCKNISRSTISKPTARRRIPKFLYGYISGGAETDAARARQPQGLRRIRLRAARAQRRLRPRPDHDAVRQDLRLAVRHSADGLFGAVRLSRRHRADAGGEGRERADDPQRLLADHAGGRARRQSGGVVPGLSRRPARADRAAGRSGGGGRLRHLRRHRRRAGAAEPREQHPQRLSGAARDHAARVLGHGHASALAVRHLGAHREELRHAAFREHGRQARPAGAGEKPDAQYRRPRPARLEACRTDPQDAGRASSSSRDWSRRRMRASRARAASTA